MRSPHAVILALVCGVSLFGCGSAPDLTAVPAPWDPTEDQLSEPKPVPDAGVPRWDRIGNSIRGKPIQAMTLGRGKTRIYVVGGLHGDEPEGPQVAAKLPAALLRDFTGSLGDAATLRIIRDGNPDGTALNSRGNTRGTDLNRNFPTRDFNPESLPGRRQGPRAASELETTVLLHDLKAFKPDVVIVFRTAQLGRGPVVAFDGPGLTRAYDFASSARGEDPRWRVSGDKSFVSPGSIDSLVARDLRKPVLSVEFRRGGDIGLALQAVRAGIDAVAAAGGGVSPTARAQEPPADRDRRLGGLSK